MHFALSLAISQAASPSNIHKERISWIMGFSLGKLAEQQFLQVELRQPTVKIEDGIQCAYKGQFPTFETCQTLDRVTVGFWSRPHQAAYKDPFARLESSSPISDQGKILLSNGAEQ